MFRVPEASRGSALGEAVLADIVEQSVPMDPEQGGFTSGTGAILRVFILWTVVVYRLVALRQATCGVLLDLASVFDTSSPALVAVRAFSLGALRRVAQYIHRAYKSPRLPCELVLAQRRPGSVAGSSKVDSFRLLQPKSL